EAALGHAHVQRHLAAFEAGDGDAGARLLALHAATGGLALARARAAADAHAALGRALAGAEVVEFGHRRPSLEINRQRGSSDSAVNSSLPFRGGCRGARRVGVTRSSAEPDPDFPTRLAPAARSTLP